MKVNIIGTIFGFSGYDLHTRGLANGLNELGIDVRLDVPKIPQWERMCNDFEFKAIEKPFNKDMISILIGQPQYLPFFWSQKPKETIPFIIWEGSHVPYYWKKFLFHENTKRIIVPSNHVKSALLNTFNDLIKPIVVIPHGYNPKVFYPERKTKWKPFEDVFIVTANKGFSQGLYDRGGLQWLLIAYSNEFTNKDNIELRVHINPVYNNPSWNIDEELKKIGLEKREDRPKILITTDLLNENALRNFYNEGNVFVSTSMADAFNLPHAESMACGLAQITTNFGGQTDYITEETGLFIKKGELLNWSKEIIYEETKWFKPDIIELKRLLRYAYNNQDKIKEMGERAHKFIIENYTWKHSALKLKRILENGI